MNKNIKTALKSLTKNRLKDVERNSKILKGRTLIIDDIIKQVNLDAHDLEENWRWFCDNLLSSADVNAKTRWADGDIVGKLLDNA